MAAIATIILVVATTMEAMDGNRTVSPRVIPSLVDRTLTFEKLGTYSAGRDMGHIMVELNVQTVIKDYNQVVDQLESVHTQAYAKHTTRVKKEDKSLFAMNATFMGLYEHLNDVANSLEFACKIAACNMRIKSSSLYPPRPYLKPPVTGNSIRVKRQFGVLMGTAALGLSIYTLGEVELLKAELQDANAKVNHIFSQMNNDHTLLRQNAEHLFTIGQALNEVFDWREYESFKLGELALTGYIEDFASNLQNWADGFLLVALGKQISPRFFRVEELERALEHVTTEAKRKGLKPVATGVTDLAHEEMSVIRQGQTVFALLHLPLGVADPYELYRLIDTPLALSDGRTARVVLDLDLLATNDQFSEHAELSSTSLQGCTQRKQAFLCPNGLTSKRMDNSCLGALFVGNAFAAARLCTFTASFQTRESITQISGTKVLVYSPPNVTTSVYITCQGGIGSKHLLVNGHSEVEVGKHCLLNTETFVFKPTRTFDIKDIFVSRPLVGIGPAILKVGQIGRPPAFNYTPPSDPGPLVTDLYRMHYSMTLPTVIIIAILLLLPILVVYGWKRRRRLERNKRLFRALRAEGSGASPSELQDQGEEPVQLHAVPRLPAAGTASWRKIPAREEWLELQTTRSDRKMGEGTKSVPARS